MLDPFLFKTPLDFKGRGFVKSRFPSLFDEQLYSKAFQEKSLPTSLKFWKENSTTIENFLSFVVMTSFLDRSTIIKLVFLDEQIQKNIPLLVMKETPWGDSFTYLMRECLEVAQRKLEIGKSPFSFAEYFPELHLMTFDSAVNLIRMVAPDVGRLNRLSKSDNADLVVSNYIDIRKHGNIISDMPMGYDVNGISSVVIDDSFDSDERVWIGRFYAKAVAWLTDKYYQVPRSENEPERLPLKLFGANIDSIFDIKKNIVNKYTPYIESRKHRFERFGNLALVDYRKYFTELTEGFYGTSELTDLWIKQCNEAIADIEKKLETIKGEFTTRFITVDGIFSDSPDNFEKYINQIDKLRSMELSGQRWVPVPLEKKIYEAHLLVKLIEIYKLILKEKLPLFSLITTIDSLKIKKIKSEEYLEVLKNQFERGDILYEKEFAHVDRYVLWRLCSDDVDLLFACVSTTPSYSAFLASFYKIRAKALSYSKDSKENHAMDYIVYRFMKNAKTYSFDKGSYVEPQGVEVQRTTNDIQLNHYLDNPIPYMPANYQDVIEFGDKYDLLPSQVFEAFTAKVYIAKELVGYPRGVIEAYISYLTSSGAEFNTVSKQELEMVMLNAYLVGDYTYTDKDFVTNIETPKTVSKVVAIYDKTINAFPHIKEIYKKVGQVVINPNKHKSSGPQLMSIDEYWDSLTQKLSVNGIAFIKNRRLPSEIKFAQEEWTKMELEVDEAQKKASEDFGRETVAYFKHYENTGDELVTTGVFTPLFRGKE